MSLGLGTTTETAERALDFQRAPSDANIAPPSIRKV